MSPDPTVQALVDAWDAFARAHGFNPAHDGMPSGSAWRGLEVMEEVLRAHVLITGDARAMGLMHALGQAAVSMERALDPEGFEQRTQSIRQALSAFNPPTSFVDGQSRLGALRTRAMALGCGDAQQGDRARQALSQTPPPASA